MSQKPIKRSAALTPLSRDHHEGLLLGWKIRAGFRLNVEVARIRSYVLHFFNQHLKTHFREEEELVFTALPADNDMKIAALQQHEELLALAGKLDDTATGINELLNEIADELDKHIRFEERELFPYIEKTIEPAMLAAIGAKIEEVHQKVDITWEDEFWAKKP